MTEKIVRRIGRRTVIKGSAAALGLGAAASFVPTRFAIGQQAPIKVGLMLPYTGTFAQLGANITEAFKLHVEEKGGRLAGRPVEYVQLDDESDPAKAPQNMTRLIQRDRVDVVCGTVHSGVMLGMLRVARGSETLVIIPNAGQDEATGALCSPNVFRVSFSNWQPAFPCGKAMYDRGVRRAVAISWRYAAGEQAVNGFKEGFTQAGGQVLEEMYLPFPNVEFQPLLTRIAQLNPDGVFCFFAGGGAVKFVTDYAAAGLRRSIPLFGSGFLTDGTLPAQGEAANGLLTTLHYADGLDNPKDRAFRQAFEAKARVATDVYAVQGYDAAQLLAIGLEAVRGDTSAGARQAMYGAMRAARIDSPRGAFTLSPSQNPVQDIYLREVRDGKNMFVEVAHRALADPGRGCSMA
jgi:branched-chain amino acid transport system substrate-binding protein